MAELPPKRTVSNSSEIPKSHSKSLETKVSALYLTLQIYSYEDVGTGVPRHTRIPEGMLFSEGIHNKKCIIHGIRHNESL